MNDISSGVIVTQGNILCPSCRLVAIMPVLEWWHMVSDGLETTELPSLFITNMIRISPTHWLLEHNIQYKGDVITSYGKLSTLVSCRSHSAAVDCCVYIYIERKLYDLMGVETSTVTSETMHSGRAVIWVQTIKYIFILMPVDRMLQAGLSSHWHIYLVIVINHSKE